MARAPSTWQQAVGTSLLAHVMHRHHHRHRHRLRLRRGGAHCRTQVLGPTHCTGASLQRWCKAWCKVAAGPVGPTYMYMYVVPAPHVGLRLYFAKDRRCLGYPGFSGRQNGILRTGTSSTVRYPGTGSRVPTGTHIYTKFICTRVHVHSRSMSSQISVNGSRWRSG